MVLTAKVYVDGGCRGNGSPDSIGAAAAWLIRRSGERKVYVSNLPKRDQDGYAPTNQRAELIAIGNAFRLIDQQLREFSRIPRLDIEIFSDSRYAIGRMTEWAYRWERNGWRHSDGTPVANRKLIQRTLDLENEFLDFAHVRYTWIPRSENVIADRLCNEAMDEQEEIQRRNEEAIWGETVWRRNQEAARREAAARRAREERLRIAREQAEEQAREEAGERRPIVRLVVLYLLVVLTVRDEKLRHTHS